MKYTHPYISEVLEIEDTYVTSLVIENGKLFRDIVSDFMIQSAGEEGKGVLSKKDRPIEMSKNVEIMSSLVPFEVNTKNILSKLQGYLEKKSVDSDLFMLTQKLLGDIECFIYELSADLTWDVECKKLSVSSIIKGAGVEIKSDAQTFAEKIYDYMDIVRQLDKDRLFVFVNLRSYLDDEEAFALFETAVGHRFRMLLIDNCEKERSPLEKRLIIDEDLCEI